MTGSRPANQTACHCHVFWFTGRQLIFRILGIYVAALQHATSCWSLGDFLTLCLPFFNVPCVSSGLV